MSVARFALWSPYIFMIGTLVIGLVTPGYDHMSRTISRLFIEKYGLAQTLNMYQLVAALIITGAVLSRNIRSAHASLVVRITMYITAMCMFLIAIFPTDPIDNARFLDMSLTVNAKIHIGLVVLFILMTPVGIYYLWKTFQLDDDLRPLAPVTAALGFSAVLLSVVWFAFFYFGILMDYRGLFQKIIILPVMLWFILLTRKLVALKA